MPKITVERLILLLCAIGVFYFVVSVVAGIFIGSPENASSSGAEKSVLRFSDDLDLGCNAYPLDARVETQRRILNSVRQELSESSKTLRQATAEYERIIKEVEKKKAEFDSINKEIASSIRILEDLRDRRNVQVFLPHDPLSFVPVPEPSTSPDQVFQSLDDALDFRRCGISSSFAFFLYPLEIRGVLGARLHEAFRKSQYLVENSDRACIFILIVESSTFEKPKFWSNNGRNHIVINAGKEYIGSLAAAQIVQGGAARLLPNALSTRVHLDVPSELNWEEMPSLLPYQRKYLFACVMGSSSSSGLLKSHDIQMIKQSAAKSNDSVLAIDCSTDASDYCENGTSRLDLLRRTTFTVVAPSPHFYAEFYRILSAGSIPVVLSTSVVLPFEACISWELAVVRIPPARIPELHFIVRSFPMEDVFELRRQGRIFWQTYLSTTTAVSDALLSCMARRLRMPIRSNILKAEPLFNGSFTPPIMTPVNQPPPAVFDDEYLGPLEAPFNSVNYKHNFSALEMYSRKLWDSGWIGYSAPEYLPFSFDPPTDAQYAPDSSTGFRPIAPGSGREFSASLGGNRPREQFTVVLITYNRDAVLSSSLERLHKMPYLNKVIVIWNNIDRLPPTIWPRLHVPVEFIKVPHNSLNNRFIPWDRIETEAVLSLDDDIDLKQYEIILAFRVWRENRDRIVGFPARFHARFGDDLFYNSNHTCQLSMILTGAAFLHKSYLHAYTYMMPSVIREHVDKVMNCEDIAMNFLVSHLTRKPPIKTTSRWTLKCPACAETLSEDESHFTERHECIRLFTKIYGYNPLLFSQFRADSVLFKTKVPTHAQKCFRWV